MKQIIAVSCYLLLNISPVNAEWQTLYQENFEQIRIIHSKKWQEDTFPDNDQYSEKGSYFTSQCIDSPQGYRLSTPFGLKGWLTAESYTHNRCTKTEDLLSVVSDPDGGQNKVLRLSSPEHTDASLIRSSHPLQGRYRISLKVGFADFGSGTCLNGYNGEETAKPWLDQSAINENGFYWLSIADTVPRPHNNIWWHHHRKIVIDTDNHFPAWMKVWNGDEYISSGKHPIMMFVLDGNGTSYPETGKPFISFSQWKWHPSGEIKAVDAYLPDQWYEVVIERDQNVFTLKVSGHFAYGGYRDYVATIDASKNCIWHYNRISDQKNTDCYSQSDYENDAWPDYFFFGDPHINFYEGDVFYDDIKLEVWLDEKQK